MSAFSYFNGSCKQLNNDGESDGGAGNDIHTDPKDSAEDKPDDLFLPPFTPRSCMEILCKSFASNSSTSYLVSKEAVNLSLNLEKPIYEDPYFTQEPDWSLIRKCTTGDLDQASGEKLLERCQALETTLNRAKQQICACDTVIEALRATAAILKLQAQKLQSALHKKEESQKGKAKKMISLNVGDGAVITEDEFIRKVEMKKNAQEKRKKDLEGWKKAREKKHMLKNAQKQAWEVVCNEYEIEKARHERVCQELRENGTRVRDLPQKPKRRPQKEVSEEVREQWAQEAEADGNLMEVDGEVSELDGDCEVEFLGEDSGVGPDGSYGSEGEEKDDDKVGGEDPMDINKL